MDDAIKYQLGIPESLRADAALLFDEAFGAKFAIAIADRDKRLALLKDSLSLTYAIAAIQDDKLVGLAGFQTPTGSLTDGITLEKLRKHLGIFGGLWAAVLLSLYEREAQEGKLLMDGIVVNQKMRGYGIGTKLLNEMKEYASVEGYSCIRLDVIDTNPGARRLYEKQGFMPTKSESFEYLRSLLGFGASTTMIYRIQPKPECTEC